MRARAVVAVLMTISLALATASIAFASHDSLPGSTVDTHGVDVLIDNTSRVSDRAVMEKAEKLFSYVEGLGANAVSLNFPFFMNGLTDSDVFPEAATPSPALMRTLIEVAESDGLQVQLRPLVELNGGKAGAWRGIIQPQSVSEWFRAYWDCLEPYAIVAAQTDVTSFSIGAELNSLVEDAPVNGSRNRFGWNNDIPYWEGLVQEFRSVVGNGLLYSASRLSVSTIPGIAFGYDEYTPVDLPSNRQPMSSTPMAQVVNEFTASIEQTIHRSTFPALSSVSLEEVDLGAYVGAWRTPWMVGAPSGTPVARWVQADWDTAMCNVFLKNNMAGIYFWTLNLPRFSSAPNKANGESFGGFVGTATASAIASCFARAGGN